jgi:hypothetical protein
MIRFLQALLSPRLAPQPSRPARTKHNQGRRRAKNRCGGSHRTIQKIKPNGGRGHSRPKWWSLSGNNKKSFIAYHGTPSTENAKSIVRHGWMVGSGNAAGDGIYLAQDLATAKSYAGSQGVYVKCRVSGSVCQWTHAIQAQHDAWCAARGVRQDNSARTAFLIQQGFEVLQTGTVLVVLAPQFANPTAYKRKDRRIRILGIYRASDDRRVKV